MVNVFAERKEDDATESSLEESAFKLVKVEQERKEKLKEGKQETNKYGEKMNKFERYKKIERMAFMKSPGKGMGMLATSYYTTLKTQEIIALYSIMSRSDTVDVTYVRRSSDNGRTWVECESIQTREQTTAGIRRIFPSGGYLDPFTGRYISFWIEGILPTDDPLEGMKYWTVWYSVSEDGGRTEKIRKQIVHEGAGFDEAHPLPGVTIGKSGFMIGDFGEQPITRSDGAILLPIQVGHIDGNGNYYNPGGGYTYTDCLLLIGKWKKDGSLAWRSSQRVIGDPTQSTRGLIEPTIAELDGGRLLMVMRGSNEGRPDLPGWRWYSFSDDGGETWSKPQPWKYTNGDNFFSPSSCSQLITYRDGRIFWVGNISYTNPEGNSPRYPLVIGEVDRKSGFLRKETIKCIDDRNDGESPHLTLSNFYVREDRESGDLLLHLTRFFAHDFRENNKIDWTADAMLYRIMDL